MIQYIKFKHLSLGNAQRLGIAKAIIHKPKILILDEPTNGLDPAGIVEVRRLLMDLARNSGVTILMSSHKLDEISKVATDIGIIHGGKLIKKINSKQLEGQLKKSLLLDGKNKTAIKSVLSKNGYDIHIRDSNSTKKSSFIQIDDGDAVNNPDRIAKILVNAGHPPTLLKIEKENLEEYFLRVINDLLALPISRNIIVLSKFIVSALWCFVLSLLVLVSGFIVGKTINIPGWSFVAITQGVSVFVLCSILTILLSTPVAFFASIGRGYLSPLGFMMFTLVLSQIIAAIGYGHFFPWSVPALISGIDSSNGAITENAGIIVVFVTSLFGLIGTMLWWRYADQQ